VRDWRVTQLQKMANVAIYRENDIGASDVLEFGAERVVLATGCHWRRDGYGRSNGAAIPGFAAGRVFTPDDLMRGRIPDGPVLLFDDDAFYIGSVMAEVLCAAGREVIYVTADDVVASWTTNTQEFKQVQKRLRSLGMQIITGHNIRSLDSEGADLVCVYSDREQRVSCASVVAVTARLPNDKLETSLLALAADWQSAGVEAVTPIGDCHAPGLIVHAVYAGHRYARELEEPAEGEVCFRRRASQPPMT
jgi:dimethylamine/trimethylamine dehydrogenase